MPTLLDVRGLHAEFAASTGRVRVLNGMDIAVSTGEALGVVGESGSGKTVLLRAILGLLQSPWRVGPGEELLRAVGIPAPEARFASYPHEMSGGMCQRVIIAMALAHAPKLLLADEPTAGLDVTISRQILDLMSNLIRDTGSSLLLVSRDLGVVAHYCQTIAVVYAGQVVETAPVADFFENPAHPYSRRLLRVATAA